MEKLYLNLNGDKRNWLKCQQTKLISDLINKVAAPKKQQLGLNI